MKKQISLIALAVVLLMSAIGWDYYQRQNFSDEVLTKQISSNIVSESENLVKESQSISSLQWNNLQHTFFLIDSIKILKWNSSAYPITFQELSGDFTWTLLHVSHSSLLAYKAKINSSQF